MMICLFIVQSFRALHYKKVPLQQKQREFRKISVPQVSLLCVAPAIESQRQPSKYKG